MHDPSERTGDAAPLAELQLLLLQYLDAPAEQRDVVLLAICGERPDLAEALRERVDVLQRVGFIDDGTPPAAAISMPEQLGGFRLLERLGRGSMGVLYRAEQTALGRPVALKLLRPDALSSDVARQRFRREANALSRVDHPAICPIYEVGEFHEFDGAPYLAMRLIDGRDLEALLETHRAGGGGVVRLPGSTGKSDAAHRMHVAALIASLARGVHAAHERGFVHRDLKPANMMIGDDGQPVVIDFGLAQATDAGRLTWSGELVGSPAYMAPEQIDAQGPVDRRTDVYALGAILFECLTGARAFVAPTREGLFRRILAGDHGPTRGRMPADFAAVVEKAIDREPRRRYSTALALAEDLDRIRRFEPVSARPAGPWLRARRWTRRQPVVAAVLASLTIWLPASAFLLAQLERARRDERVQRMVAEVESLAASSPRDATRLALAAYEARPDDPSALGAVHRQLACDHEQARCDGHTGAIWFARFSPDGERLVTCSDDGSARIWDAETGSPLHRPLWHVGPDDRTRPVLDASFSPDRDRPQVLTAAMDGTVRVWSETGLELFRFAHPVSGTAMSRARFSPDGNTVLALAWDGRAWLWEPVTDRATELEGHLVDTLWDGGFSPDGTVAATSVASGVQIEPRTDDFTARLWNVSDGTERAVLPHRDEVLRVCFAHRRPWVLTASFDGTAKLWDLKGSSLVEFGGPSGHRAGLYCANFSPDDRLVVTGSLDGTARLWDAESGTLLNVLHHDGFVMSAEFSPDGQRVLTADVHGIARIWDLAGREVLRFLGHRDLVMGGCFSPDGERVATASWDRSARIWRAHDPELPRRVGPAIGLRGLAAGPMPGVLAAAGVDGTLLLWEPGHPTPRRFEHDRLSRVLFDDRGGRLVTAQEDHTVTVWRRTDERAPLARYSVAPVDGSSRGFRDCSIAMLADDRVLIATQYGRVLVRDLSLQPAGLDRRLDVDGEIVCVAVDRAGNRFAVGVWGADSTGRVMMFDLGGDRLGPPLAPHRSRVSWLAFSPCGTYLASASDDATARIWDLPSGAPAKPLVGHERSVTWVGFAPDCGQLATTSRDGTARLWKPTGELITKIDVTRTGAVLGAAYSVDGLELFTATDHGLVLTWKVRRADAIALARRRAGELVGESR